MAIPTPTVPSTVTAISAVRLNSTQNNRAFYINSGLIGANNSDTTVISIDSIGKRDVIFCMNPILAASATTDNMYMTVKSQGEVIYYAVFDTQRSADIPSPIHFILPANTSLEVLFANQTSTSRDVGVSAYGYYLENI